jgi:two-component system, sensor histidine kinase PdtaS
MNKKMSLGLVIFLNCFLCFEAGAQTSIFHKPSEYKTSWQRLLLQLSQAFYTSAEETQANLDTNLIYCAHSLGLSRLPVIAEGIDAPDLTGQLKWIDQRTPGVGLQMLSGSTGKKHLELLVLMGAYYAFEPGNYDSYKDSVLFFLNQAVTESKAQHEQQLGLQARLLIGKMYVGGYDFQHGDSIFDHLIKDCQSAGDNITEAKAWFYRAWYTGYTILNLPKRIAYQEVARQLYHRQHNTEGEISALTQISYLNVPSYQLNKAYDASIEALSLVESIHFPYTHYNTDVVTMITSFDGKFGEPLKYGFETVRAAESTHDDIGLGVFYDRIGLLYFAEDMKHEGAQKWFEKAVYTLMRTNENIGLYRIVSNLVNSFNASGHPDKALNILTYVSTKAPPKTILDKLHYNLAYSAYYTNTNKYNIAQKYLTAADSLEQQLEKNGYNFRQAGVLFAYGELNYFRGNYVISRSYLERYLYEPSHIGTALVGELDALLYLIDIDSIQGNNALEVRHRRLYQKLADSSYKISKIRQAEELQVKYATAEKENQITLLSQNAKLERANLNKATLIKNVTIVGIVLVLVIAGLLYRQNRLRKKSNELLERLLTEKEWLLKEVHHRVKNNLHTIICLLESQAAYLENDALKAIEISQHRIYAMSLIHQKLYQSQDIKMIGMDLYINEFVQYLADSFGPPSNIRIKLVIEPLKLGISQAIPLGLILNEAVTNSFKYAFPDNKSGEIVIGLKQIGNIVELVISDNGIGIQHHVDENEPHSLGIELMKGLTRDIKGSITFAIGIGTKINVTFAVDSLDRIGITGISSKRASLEYEN